MIGTKTKKRILSVMLAILSCLFFISPMNSHSITMNGSCGENVKWSLDDGVLKISGSGKMDDFKKDAAVWKSLPVGKVVIEDGVTSVGSFAFSGCKDLVEVSMAPSVESIGEGAFSDCTGLKAVTIPHNVTSVGKDFLKGSGVKTVFAFKKLTLSVPDGVTLYSYDTTGEMKGGVIEAELILKDGQTAPTVAMADPYRLKKSSADTDEKDEDNGYDRAVGVRITEPGKIAWVKFEGNWYGLDTTGFKAGDVFIVKPVSKSTVAKLDTIHKDAAAKDTLRTFDIEVIHDDGTICNDYPKPFNLYVQFDKNWDLDSVRMVCIDDGKDIVLDTKTMDWGFQDSDAKMKVAKVTLDKFGSFAMYEDEVSASANNEKNEDLSYFSKTADTLTNTILFALPAIMMLALCGIYVSLKKKKTN